MYMKENIYTRRMMLKDGKALYFISFTDGYGNNVEIEVDAKIYDVVREFQLIDERLARSDRRHMEWLALSDSEIDTRAEHVNDTTEKLVLLRLCAKETADTIYELPPTKRRRFLLHRYMGVTLGEIAKMEGVSFSVVQRCVKNTEKTLQKIQKKFTEKCE